MLLIKEIVMIKKYIPGKIKIDTFPGRNMRVSPIERRNHSGPRIYERPHLLAPAYHKVIF